MDVGLAMELDKKAARLAYARHYARVPALKREGRARGMDELTISHLEGIGTPDDLFELANIDLDKLGTELDFATSVGERIKKIRKAYSLTQAELADVLGVKQASVSRWEKNKADVAEEALEVLGYMAMQNPGIIRYGRREPLSSGELVPEKPVVVIGVLDADGSIDVAPKSQQTLTVARPREGRPHDDVVGVAISSTGGFSLFQGGDWYFFYRTGVKSLPEMRIGEVCVLKTRDTNNLFLALILSVSGDDVQKTCTVMLSHGSIARYYFEWASPVLAFRQNIEDTVG